MPARRASIRKVREILRLKYFLCMGPREIGRSCSLSHSTVREYLKRATAIGLRWPLEEKWNDAELEKALFGSGSRSGNRRSRKPLPDFGDLRQRLADSRSLTLQDLWDEWESAHPGVYSYSRYCALYQRWRDGQDYRSGGRLIVYWADGNVPICNRQSGVVQMEASIFVAVLSASNYTFVHAAPDRSLHQWIASHVKAFEFIGGVPPAVVYDRRSVGRSSRYEPDLNRTYQELAEHFGTGVMPGTLRDRRKGSRIGKEIKTAHAGVIAAIGKEKFFTIADLNSAISEVIDWWNIQPYQRGESRRVLFEHLDLAVLRPLPEKPYNFAEWKKCRVSVDYHVEADGHYYSVPYILAGTLVDVRCTTLAVEIFDRGTRVAFHRRSSARHQHTTIDGHMPTGHLAHLAWSPGKLMDWANRIGESTGELIRTILCARAHPEMGYRASIGVLRLAKTCGPERLETACRCALQRRACSYQSVRSILRNMADERSIVDPGRVRDHAPQESVERRKVAGSDRSQSQASLFDRLLG